MPTRDPRAALDLDAARDLVAEAVMPPASSGTQVGLEVEVFPVDDSDHPTRRVPLDDPQGPAVRGVLAANAVAAGGPLPTGGTVTVEPGGQIEVSTTCCTSVDEALAESDRSLGLIAGWFEDEDVSLLSAGIDVWHDLADVPQQLRAPRYPAMAAYFAMRGDAGATMMRHTCALQMSFDLGTSDLEVEQRWLAANLLAPIATATFANSPASDGNVRSRRSLAWQQLDPTRTGFPADLLAGTGALTTQAVQAALTADVLLVRTEVDNDGTVTAATPGRPGWSFHDWLTNGDGDHGWPTRDDLRYHLTTLFPEVRARGPIEIRSIDALPRRWRAVPVVLYAGALYDNEARSRILEVLEATRLTLPRRLRQAAITGVSDPAMCAQAVEVWSYALAGASRLHGIDRTHLATAERFLDRFSLRGRCPADDLAASLMNSPNDAVELVREPAPTLTRSTR